MRTLIVGNGSIGRRHARILAELGCDVAMVSRRPPAGGVGFQTVAEALAIFQPAYVVVANRTDEHALTVEQLIQGDFRGRLLIEKPLGAHPSAMPEHSFAKVAVGYNLRCDPLLGRLRSLTHSSTCVSTVSVYVGYYLPDWRPESDYRESYSANRSRGGGVLRDLSHELDYVQWIFGGWKRLTALGGHFSGLTIDSDDAFTIIMETERCPLVTIHLNYLDRVSRREIVVNADQMTYRVDLVHSTFASGSLVDAVPTSRDDTYRAEHVAMIGGEVQDLCTIADAERTLATIEAAERAAAERVWIVQ